VTTSDPASTTGEQARSRAAVSIIIPAYNEEAGVAATIADIHNAMSAFAGDYEVVVVDDGSTDRTAERAGQAGARLIHHRENRGYGAALKTGIRKVRYDKIVITDADGTYPVDVIPQLVKRLDEYDMVVGARTGEAVHVPLARRPAKWLLQTLASFLAGCPIPDLNSGLRAMRRDVIEIFEHILPSGFSFTTTITLALLCNDYMVDYLPINYRTRVGDSKVRAPHAYDFFLLIVRTIVYFNPLKIFLPLGAILFLAGSAKLVYDIYLENLSESAVLAFLGAIIVWAIGLLSDQISRTGIWKRNA